jgi:hypothetical protein
MLSAISTSQSGSGSPCESEDPLGRLNSPPPRRPSLLHGHLHDYEAVLELRREKREAIGCLADVRWWDTSEGP